MTTNFKHKILNFESFCMVSAAK